MPGPASGVPPRKKKVGSAEQDQAAEPRFLVIGRVRTPHGVRGEIRVQLLTDFHDRFSPESEVWLGDPPERHVVQKARFDKDDVLLKLDGMDDRNSVEGLRGFDVLASEGVAMPLPANTYLVRDIVGLEVWTDAGENLGKVAEVLSLPANDVYVVDSQHGEILLPAIADVILNVDVSAGRMTVHLLPGLV